MDWNAVLWVPIQTFFNQLVGEFLPRVAGALLILLVGWIIAKIVETAVIRLLKTIQLDRLAEQIQLSDLLAKGGIRRKLSELVGVIIYWLIMFGILIAALNVLNLNQAAQLLQGIVAFLPNVVAALFIIIVGALIGTFLATTVRTAASNAGITQAHLLGQLVQTIIVVFVSVAALQQLNIQFVGEAFLVILAAVGLGLALAFGLGCKDLAGRWMSGLVDQFSSRKR